MDLKECFKEMKEEGEQIYYDEINREKYKRIKYDNHATEWFRMEKMEIEIAIPCADMDWKLLQELAEK